MAITASIVGSSFLTVMLNGSTVTINSDHGNYAAIREALKLKDHVTVERLINVVNSVINFVRGKVSIKNEKVFYGEMEVKGPVVSRILAMVRENFDAQPMLSFLANLMDNPSKTAIDELYLFLEASSLPITEDGCFLAYKKVNDNYKDFYTNKFDNSIGAVCSVPRNTVDDKRANTCSYGLHFCSLSYLPQYHGDEGRVMIVKINPKDVVSIPSDYNNAKGRTCEYTVVGEHSNEITDAFTSPVYRDAVPVTPPDRAPYVAPQDEHDTGYDTGYDAGYNAGSLRAIVDSDEQKGYDPGYNPSPNRSDDYVAGYEKGYQTAYSSGLKGYNTGRSDASRGYRSGEVVGSLSYIEAYEKGWNSVMNLAPVVEDGAVQDEDGAVQDEDDAAQDEYDTGYDAGSFRAIVDSDEQEGYDPSTDGSYNYVDGYEDGYKDNYSVDWQYIGSEAGEDDAAAGNPYNDMPTNSASTEEIELYREGYADGWHEVKLKQIHS